MKKAKKVLAICLAVASMSCFAAVTASANSVDYNTWYAYTQRVNENSSNEIAAETYIRQTSTIEKAHVYTNATEVDNHGYRHDWYGNDYGPKQWAKVTWKADSGYQIASAHSNHTVWHKSGHQGDCSTDL